MSHKSPVFLLVFLLSSLLVDGEPLQQRYERVLIEPATSRQTMKPVVRGTQYAAASMATQATMAVMWGFSDGGLPRFCNKSIEIL